MLSDAKSLWASASSFVSKARETVGRTIEQLDLDLNAELESELQAYKRLLEESQMQHFQLSRQTRLLLAEKEAEITVLKQSSEATGGKVDPLTFGALLEVEKFKADKEALTQSLAQVEDKLKSFLTEQNAARVEADRHKDVQARLAKLQEEHAKLVLENDAQIKSKTETVDNLVAEYSQLAAEYELTSTRDQSAIAELKRVNERLSTRQKALEHSITDLADRATVQAGGGGDDQQQAQELRAARATVLSLQFDVKERDDALAGIKAELEAAKRSAGSASNSKDAPPPPSTGAGAAELTAARSEADKAKAALSSANEDNSRLRVEVKEAQDAGKGFLEQLKKSQKELEELKRALAQSKKNATESEESAASVTKADALVAELKGQLEEKDKAYASEIEAMQKQISALQASGSDTTAQLSAQLAEKEKAHAAEKEALSKQIAALQASVADKDKVHAAAADALQKQITALQASSSGATAQLSAQLAEKEKAHASEIEALQKQLTSLQASSSEKDKAHSAENEALSKQIAALQASVADKDKAHAAEKAALEGQISALQASSEKLTGELSSMRAAADDVAARHEALSGELAELKEAHQRQQAAHAEAIETAQREKESEAKRHESELAAALTALRAEASAAQQQAVEQTRASVQAEALREKASALEEQESKLRQEGAAELAAGLKALAERLSAEHAQAQEQAVSTAVAETQQRAEAALQAALSALRTQHAAAAAAAEAEHAQQLSDAADKHAAELESTVARLKEEAEADAVARVSACQAAADTVIAAANAARDQSLADQKNVEARYEVKMTQALEAAEARFKEQLQKYIDSYSEERARRRAIHNKLLELQGNIRVLCRVRPVLEIERRHAPPGEEVDVTEFPSEADIVVQRDPHTKTKFEFDRVFAPASSQSQVFEHVQPLCVSVLDGYNVCIFAYGQTGSGKTFTMEGSSTDPGVSPRAVGEIFRAVREAPAEWSYSLRFSMLEVYNEQILDLLAEAKGGEKERLDVRQAADGKGNVVAGLIELDVDSPERVFELMAQGQANRAVGAHDMNEHSSRSHSILTITIQGSNSLDGTRTAGKLNLIDLAGSERISKTDATGDRLKEAQNINKSLSALGDVIAALGNKKNTHVPFRNSKLTFLLQDSLGGNSKVLMFSNISPAVFNMGETVCTLNFAARCRAVELGSAKINKGPAGPAGAAKTASAK